MELKDLKEIKGKITLKTGLHIGGGDTEMRIGGLDNPVIKHPHTLEPYIPGSSIKGKVRSLLEMRSGLMKFTKGEPVSLQTLKDNHLTDTQKLECKKLLKLFGAGALGEEQDKDEDSLGPTRVSFADCPLNQEWLKRTLKRSLPLTEIKSENIIDRIKGTAEHPRSTERVPADTEFEFKVSIKQFEGDEPDLLEYLLEGLKLLEMDALGGSGSRGYGRIEFSLEMDDEDITERFKAIKPFPQAG